MPGINQTLSKPAIVTRAGIRILPRLLMCLAKRGMMKLFSNAWQRPMPAWTRLIKIPSNAKEGWHTHTRYIHNDEARQEYHQEHPDHPEQQISQSSLSALRRMIRNCCTRTVWRNVSGIFWRINFGGFCRGISWRIFCSLFPTTTNKR